MAKIWHNAQVVWDADSDPSNAGWVVKVDEEDGEGRTDPMTYSPHPDYYSADKGADTEEILRATVQWEKAEVIGSEVVLPNDGYADGGAPYTEEELS